MARISLSRIREWRLPRVSPRGSKKSRGPRFSLSGFKDPARQPRYIIWTIVCVFVLAGIVIVALGVTSTRWFCSEGCHKVQDDTIRAYNHSSHNKVSCMACHMPVNANPITFVLHKAEALGELYLTLTDNFELPLNAESAVALEMKPQQCTQCHNLEKRVVTPAVGILIDHQAHAREDIACAVCHNRIAHNEDFDLKLTDPKTGDANRKHEQFMSMTACFRCHEQSKTGRAPGRCPACHPAGFKLKPASHLAKGFFPKGHAVMALEEASRTAEAKAQEDAIGASAATEGEEPELRSVASVNKCSTCHNERFCTDCHGAPMPHPDSFKKRHGKEGKKNPRACAQCHGDPSRFCDECHHGKSLSIPYVASVGPWRLQHPAAVRALGASRCFECHDPTYCSHCHVKGINQ